MIKKILFPILITSSLLFADFQEIRIGKIDRYYQDKINEKQLKDILDEIEEHFESKLGFDVFDYSSMGKPIDIVYVEPSSMEKRINRAIKRFDRKKEKISEYQNEFESKKNQIDKQTKIYRNLEKEVNDKTNELNTYINKVNQKRDVNQKEFDEIQIYVKTKKVVINQKLKELRKEQRALKRLINSFNNKVHLYNTHIQTYYALANEIESLNRGFKKVKGQAIGEKQIVLKTYIKDGITIKEKTVTNSMNKIEIYGFESLSELKAILAHEIAHLAGIPHIQEQGTLMNPILQKNQKQNLNLTYDDILNFKEHF